MIQATQTDRRNIEAAVIGSMALLPEAAEFAATELSGLEFACLDLRQQFNAVRRMTERGIAIDPITLADELVRSGDFAAAGGNDSMFEILEAVPHAAHCRFYVEQLQALHQRDCLRLLSDRLRLRAEDPTCEPSETIQAILSELETIRAGNLRQTELKVRPMHFRTQKSETKILRQLFRLDFKNSTGRYAAGFAMGN